jgi:hypothetical protein
MMNTDLQQTIFQIDKLKSVVNVGGSSAYQIFTYAGPSLGRFGAIANPEEQNPANDANYDVVTNAATGRRRPASWIKQALSALRGQE